MAFRSYLEDEDDKPYFHMNTLAFYYEDMERKQKLIEDLAKQIVGYDLKLTGNLEEVEKEVAGKLAEFDDKIETLPASVNDLLDSWVADGSIKTIIDTAIIDQKTAVLSAQLVETGKQIDTSMENGMEKAKPLFIKTFDGSHEAFHPSVKYFPTAWNGFNYWMAYTPYPNQAATPPYRDRWECPSLAVSKDGLNWLKPDGFMNPLVDLTAEEITRKDFYSDTSIVMNNNVMEIWYRKTNGANKAQTDIHRVTSTNGITWSVPEKVVDSLNLSSGIDRVVRSHQIFFNAGQYEMYFIGDNPRRVYYATSQNPSSGIWQSLGACTLNNPPAGFNPWHVGMAKDSSGKQQMLVYDDARGSVDYFEATGVQTFNFVKTILIPNKSIERWYQSDPVQVGTDWLVFASFSKNKKNGISLLKGKTLSQLSVVDVDKNTEEGYFFDGDVVLGNTVNTPRVFAVEKTGNGKTYGYGMKNSTKEPIWINEGFSDQRNFLLFSLKDVKTYVPAYDGEIIKDTVGGGLFVARKKGTAFRYVGLNTKLNQTWAIEATVDISKNEVITFTGAGADGNATISQFLGIEPYQEVTLINLSGVEITLNDGSNLNNIMTPTRLPFTFKSGMSLKMISSPFQTGIRWHIM